MRLKGERRLPVTQQAAWEALNDTGLLQRAIPGCESITRDAASAETGRYDLVLVAAIGPVKATFKGKLQLTDLDPPRAYTIRFEGGGGVAGFGKGSAAVRLLADEAGGTCLAYEGTATVEGKIAKVGARLVDIAARRIADGFFDNFAIALGRRQAAS